MLEHKTIPKEPPAKVSMNWKKLRELGIQRLEQIGTPRWTDFNLHDPGITILEALCYAITDLGYRTSFPLEDLLTHENGAGLEKDFFLPAQILPNHPVTENDLRMILVDMFVPLEDFISFDEGLANKCNPTGAQALKRVIKNAWIEKAEIHQPQIFLYNNYRFNKEVFDRIEVLVEDLLFRNEIHAKVVFEELVVNLDDFQEQVNIKKTEVRDFLAKIFEGVSFTNRFKLKQDETQTNGLKKDFNIKDVLAIFNQVIKRKAGYQLSDKELREIENLIFQGSELSYRPLEFETLAIAIGDAEVKAEFEDLIRDFSIEKEEESGKLSSCPVKIYGLNKIWLELIEEIDPKDMDTVNRILDAVKEKIHAHRSLGEDIEEIALIGIQHIGFCAEIEIEETVDKEEIQADIYHSVQEFLTPTVNFYSLQELEAEGWSCDEVFNGPLLENGYLKEEELERSGLPKVVNESDLVQVIMDLPGVKAVRFLKVFKCRGDHPEENGLEDWCLELPDNHKPVIDVDCSEIKFKIGNLFTEAEPGPVKERLRLLKKIKKKPLPEKENLRPEIPKGNYRNLEQYYSVQNLFPKTYYVGKEGPPPSATLKRKGQAKQLKGYLLFFDQLLANYLAQLSAIKNLLSVRQGIGEDDVIGPAYFEKILTEEEIPGIRDLLIQAGNGQSGIEHDFNQQIRRNQLLDHLLARFGEKFTDYSILVFNALRKPDQGHKFRKLLDVLREKAAFLESLPEISSERGKAFNYKLLDCEVPDVWDTNNISGLKKRVCKFLGIKNSKRNRISCIPEYEEQIDPDIVSGSVQKYRIRLVSKKNRKTLLSGVKEYGLKREAKNAARDLYNLALEVDKYFFLFNDKLYSSIEEIVIGSNIKEIRVVLKNYLGNTIAQSELLNKMDAIERKNEILSFSFPEEECGDEGFHVLEHILLRPDGNRAFDLLQPFRLSDDCIASDPYSFWVTIIAPKWHERFSNSNAQNFIEQVARREAPAHIGLRFLYLTNMEMVEFELPYKNWLEEKARERSNDRMLANHQNKVVQFLNKYKDKYREVTALGRTELKCQQFLDRPVQRFE